MSKTQALYFDTSALVKRYFKEQGSEQVRKLIARSDVIFTSSITYAETYAVSYRLKREGLIPNKALDEVKRRFELDWKGFAVIEFHQDARAFVPSILANTWLRGADLVQLSCALLIKERGISLQFVSADQRLVNAAEELGLSALNPSLD